MPAATFRVASYRTMGGGSRARLVAMCKSPQQRRAKRERLQAEKRRKREEAVWSAQTQFGDHWYEVRDDGVWQEHRGQPPSAARKRPKPRRRLRHSFQELASVHMRDPPPPPDDWLREANPDWLPDDDELLLLQQQQQLRLTEPQHYQPVDDEEPATDPAPGGSTWQGQGRGQRPIKLPSQPWKKVAQFQRWRAQKQARLSQMKDQEGIHPGSQRG